MVRAFGVPENAVAQRAFVKVLVNYGNGSFALASLPNTKRERLVTADTAVHEGGEKLRLLRIADREMLHAPASNGCSLQKKGPRKNGASLPRRFQRVIITVQRY